MFQLTKEEWRELITICDNLPDGVQYSPATPFAFTEQGLPNYGDFFRTTHSSALNIRNRRSIRLQGYDYSRAGAYYVTIPINRNKLCTQDRLCLFGNVTNGEMVLNDRGKIAEEEWFNTEKIRDNVQLGEFIIMPNHLHGIIIINERRGVSNTPKLSEGECNSPLRGTSNNLGAIIRGYKSAVTKWFRQNTHIYNVWQRNYYEHIIRDGDDYDRIANYIRDNPINWEQDDMYV